MATVDFDSFASTASPAPAPASPPSGGIDFDSFQGKGSGGDNGGTKPDGNVRPKPQAALPPSRSAQLTDVEAVDKNDMKKTAGDIVSLTDMAVAIPGQLAGLVSDSYARISGILQGHSHLQTSAEGTAAGKATTDFLNSNGDALKNLLITSGIGKKVGLDSGSHIEDAMAYAADLLKGKPEEVQDKTGGLLNADDVRYLANGLMNLGGAKGIVGGLDKALSMPLKAELLKLSPEAVRDAQAESMQKMDPKEAAKMPEEQATTAAEATSRAKGEPRANWYYNPITQQMEPDFPKGGNYPKPTTLETALGKVADGKSFDLTAEERIAFRGWQKEPPPQPLVDEAGQPVKGAEAPPDPAGLVGQDGKPLAGEAAPTEAKPLVGADGKPLTGEEPPPAPKPLVDASGKPLGVARSQSGAVDPKLLARMATIGLGGWAAWRFSDDHDLEHAALGAAAGLALTRIPSMFKYLREAAGPDNRIRVGGIVDEQERYTRVAAAETWSKQRQIHDLVPKAADRKALSHAIESGNTASLPPKAQQAAAIYRAHVDAMRNLAITAGIDMGFVKDYVTHIWDWSANNQTLLQKWLDKSGGSGGTSEKTPFSKERTIPTLADGIAQGLKPKSEDLSYLMGAYANSLARAIANKKMLEALKLEKTPAVGPVGPQKQIPLLLSSDKAPHSYVSLNHPQLMGLKVHPDIAPSLRLLFDTSSPGTAMKVMQGISDSTKKIAVNFSLFHAKALTDAHIGGSSNPFKAVLKIPGMVVKDDVKLFGHTVIAQNAYLKELQQGGASRVVNLAAKGGLNFELEKGGSMPEDNGVGFYASMKSLGGWLDKNVAQGAGKPIEGITAVNQGFDTFMWARLHAGMKLNSFMEKYQQLIDNSARAANKGKGVALSSDEAAKMAASYTNDLFGGLNWRRLAEDAKTRFGRDVGMATNTPGARRVSQLLFFAPDWTVSTTRAMVQAIGKPDLLNPTTLAGLHQQYLLRAAMYYLTVGDTINYANSGHHIWQNKDWSVLDMDPTGSTHMTWSKHTMEPVHWALKPGQQALNKLGMLPREALDQGLGVEYLSAKGRMPPMKNRLEHLAKNFVPISAQAGSKGSMGDAVTSFLGVPTYGKTPEEKQADKLKGKYSQTPAEKEAAREAKRKKHLEKLGVGS